MRVAAVVPTCRGFRIPTQTIPVEWYVVHDQGSHKVEGERVDVVAPDPDMFGDRSDCIRSAGFLEAFRGGADIILTVDDDCFIPPTWAEQHVSALTTPIPLWTNTMAIRARGLPYTESTRKCAISHGLWDGVPDLDGITQEKHPHMAIRHPGVWETIHPPFPQSAMNLGFIREVTPVMYQPAQGPRTPFDRFADIWGGVIAQRVLSLHGYGFRSGGAIVHHSRASNLEVNKRKEAPGLVAHEEFWIFVWNFKDKGTTIKNTYAKLAWHILAFQPPDGKTKPYFERLKERMLRWLDMLDGR